MPTLPGRLFLLLASIACMLSLAHAQSSLGTEGGNITSADASLNQSTLHWAGIVGWLNGTPVSDTSNPVSWQDAYNTTVFVNEPNGSYAEHYNISMVLTRLPFKPNLSEISSPAASDFNESGMFSSFSTFAGMNYSIVADSPLHTLCDPCTFGTCYLYGMPFSCPYITLGVNTPMGILKFDNGTHVEPLFVGVIDSLLGYNGSFFDFEYLVPAFDDYYFYLYSQPACNLTVWIDGVQTTTFPDTGVPYEVRVLVTDNQSHPLTGVQVRAAEGNGRNILYPVLRLGRELLGWGQARTDSAGFAAFVLEPTRYNIPDGYGYEAYLEVIDGYDCRANFSISSYSSLTPTYRSSLFNSSYESQVKASSQNMNSLASTASKWISMRKMRVANVTVFSNGTYGALPTLKAGAPNLLNITVYNDTTLAVINATAQMLEANGHVVFVPRQPGKDGYNNTNMFTTNETPVIIPTRYNVDANLTVAVGENGTVFATLPFTVDAVLEDPGAGEADMDDATYISISSALQNINSVLANIAKSLSTV